MLAELKLGANLLACTNDQECSQCVRERERLEEPRLTRSVQVCIQLLLGIVFAARDPGRIPCGPAVERERGWSRESSSACVEVGRSGSLISPWSASCSPQVLAIAWPATRIHALAMSAGIRSIQGRLGGRRVGSPSLVWSRIRIRCGSSVRPARRSTTIPEIMLAFPRMVQARATATHRSISRPGGAPHEAKRPQNFKVLSLSLRLLCTTEARWLPKRLSLLSVWRIE